MAIREKLNNRLEELGVACWIFSIELDNAIIGTTVINGIAKVVYDADLIIAELISLDTCENSEDALDYINFNYHKIQGYFPHIMIIYESDEYDYKKFVIDDDTEKYIAYELIEL